MQHIHRSLWLLLFISYGLTVSQAQAASPCTSNEVGLLIDEMDTGNDKHPNQASDVKEYDKSFNVYHNKIACFEVGKSYYMQYFLWETNRFIVYGTRCRYDVQKEDEGKTLLYEGMSGGTPCPIVDKPPAPPVEE